MPGVAPRRLAGNGAAFIHHVSLVDRILVAAGVTMDRALGKVRACLVELAALAVEAQTRVCLANGTSQNVQVSKFF